MSKSDPDPKSRIELTDSKDEIHAKFKKAMSDFTRTVTYEPDTRPGVSNLVEIHAAVANCTPDEVVKQAEGLSVMHYKELVAQVVNDKLEPIREEFNRLQSDRGHVEKVLENGAKEARAIASETYAEVLKAVGFR